MENNLHSVVNTVKNTILSHYMIINGDKVLVAVSGGADSVCLLHILNGLKNKMGFEIYAAHVNHGLRGEAADADMEYVKELCGGLGIKCYIKTVDIRHQAEQNDDTIEEAGRRERYNFFKEICDKNKISRIATAHNMNDQAETALMRIMRGTGLDGLCGIQYVRQDGVIRPLLDVKRFDIESYCVEFGLKYRTDSSNADISFTRNRIRIELMPYLEASFNLNIVEALSRLVHNCAQDSEFLNGYTERLYKRLCSPLPQNEPVCLHIPSLGFIENTIKVRLIKRAAREALKIEPQLESKHINSILELSENGSTGLKLDLPNDLEVSVNYDWLTFANKNNVESDTSSFSVMVEVGAEYYLEKFDCNIKLAVTDAQKYKRSNTEALLDYDKLEGKKLCIRTRNDGDRIAVYKDGRERKLKNLLIDLKVPRDERKKKIVLTAEDEVVAVLGVRVSEKYKPDKNTQRGLSVKWN